MEPTRSVAEQHEPTPALLADQVRTIREMLRTLDAQTIAGQHHVIDKVVAFVAPQIERAMLRLGPRNRRMLLEQLVLFKTEATRQVPAVPVFVRRTEGLLTLLVGMNGFVG